MTMIYILKGLVMYEEDEDVGFFSTRERAEAYKEELVKAGLYLEKNLYITNGQIDPEFSK